MSGSKGSYQRARRAAIKAGTWNPRGSGGVKMKEIYSASNNNGVLALTSNKANEIGNTIMQAQIGTEITRTYSGSQGDITERFRITADSEGLRFLLHTRADGTVERLPFNSYYVSEMLSGSKNIAIGQGKLTQTEKSAQKIEAARNAVQNRKNAKKTDNTPNTPTDVKITEYRRWQNPEWEGRRDKENPRWMESRRDYTLKVYPKIPEGTVRLGWFHDNTTDANTGIKYVLARGEPKTERVGDIGPVLGWVTEKTARAWEREYKKEHGEHSLEYRFTYEGMGISQGGIR